MTTTELESRLSAVERDLARLKAQLNSQSAAKNDPNGTPEPTIARDFASLAQSWYRETLTHFDPRATCRATPQ